MLGTGVMPPPSSPFTPPLPSHPHTGIHLGQLQQHGLLLDGRHGGTDEHRPHHKHKARRLHTFATTVATTSSVATTVASATALTSAVPTISARATATALTSADDAGMGGDAGWGPPLPGPRSRRGGERADLRTARPELLRSQPWLCLRAALAQAAACHA